MQSDYSPKHVNKKKNLIVKGLFDYGAVFRVALHKSDS